MIEQQDIDNISHLSQSQLIQLINSKSPVERTAAVRLLSYNNVFDDFYIHLLLERLCAEKSLYTKIEICNALGKGNAETARHMIQYLGKIGTNQHKNLPLIVSKKVSYPLPRDIIARTLAKMDCSVFPVLLEVLYSEDVGKISEVLDAIGFMVFYHQELSIASNLELIVKTMEQYAENEVIVWKSIVCFSAFTLQRSLDILDYITLNSKDQFIKDEAICSKNLILRREEL